jgi:hypothetical protein
MRALIPLLLLFEIRGNANNISEWNFKQKRININSHVLQSIVMESCSPGDEKGRALRE